MNFNSLPFLIFFPIVALLNFLVPRKYRVLPLLAASYYFYMSWNPELVYLILFTTAVSYFSGILIEKRPKAKTLWLVLSLTASLAVLFFFKYYTFAAEGVSSLLALFGKKVDLSIAGLILPVGISFYTFQTLSYSIDVYRGTIPAEKDFLYYALFVSFFPQLVAGPIERPENLLPQLKEEHRFSREDFRLGGKRMLAGFFKKVAVADTIAPFVERIFDDPTGKSGLAVLVASMLFAVQIYCDFSGYTDIAIGCARIMGYKLMQNFDRPYAATDIKGFWARWHISLTSWFKDYLYIPLGGNRKGKARTYGNLMIVFLVSGLWHGADLTFVLWGALHGLYRIIGILTRRGRDEFLRKIGLSPDGKAVAALRTAVTFLLVSFAWIFFRAGSLSDLGILLADLFTRFPSASLAAELSMDMTAFLSLLFGIGTLILIDRRYTKPDTAYAEKEGAVLTATDGLLLLATVFYAWMLLLAGDGTTSFLYFQF